MVLVAFFLELLKFFVEHVIDVTGVVVGFLFDFEAPLLRKLCTSPREVSTDPVAGLCSELREGTTPCSAR